MFNKKQARLRRARKTRAKIAELKAVRLCVNRTNCHIYAQIIDDKTGTTLATASTTEKALGLKTGGNIDAAKTVGKAIAERAVKAGISTVVYDRGGYVYHGRVKALIDASREAGLNKHEVKEAEAAA